jgi:PAS domain S-box-containing protein
MTAPLEYVLAPLRGGAEFILYRGRQPGDSTPILALAPASDQPAPQSLQRLDHEYSLASELHCSWAAKPLALPRLKGRTLLILKDPGGEPLDQILERNRGQLLPLRRFLRIAIGLAKALRQVHRQGLIHKDIKPANVLVDDNCNVWLTGFGIASRLPRERQAPVPLEVIAGTLAYMAPEQTGRMNRSIDARSDLYALGVTLYEMLTGVLPFTAADPLEWVHCHIARQPSPPCERVQSIPQPVSAIILKLLAKTAEQRYQTAAGVEADLRHCLEAVEHGDDIAPFALGVHDASDRLLIPERLYGREGEIGTLLAAFDRVVAHGAAELVLISGYSGIGKSSVVNELHRVLVPPRGLFVSGKFDQYKRDIPYATLAQAFQTLVSQILVKNEAEVSQWRQSILEAVGPNGQLIVNLIPELEFLIGKQPPVPELPPQDAQNRFQFVFRHFLGAFARPEHPLALFLDDLQWLDAATLELLERLVTHPEVRHVLLVGAYRDNEVSPSHPLMRTLEAIRQSGARVREMVLSPLALEDVAHLIADTLHCETARAFPLAELVHAKTGGNPFFAIQFLTALAEEHLLAFDSVSANWTWELPHIRAQNYTDNVVELMSEKLRRLSAPTQEALQHLACLGNVAASATLAAVHGKTEEAMRAVLWEAVRAGLVFPQENGWKFLHDRIQQAAYSLIHNGHRADIHLHIGRVLLATMTADQLSEHLFDVANQLNRGAARLIDSDERRQVASIDLRAGRKAKASAAYASACVYLAAGMALLDETDWDSHYDATDWGSRYDLMFPLWLERAECEFLTGNFDIAEQLIGELLQRGASKVDRAAVYHLKIQLHEVKGEYPQAVASALACLNLFGIHFPAHPAEELMQAEYQAVWSKLESRPIEELIELPRMTDPELQAAMQVLSALLGPAYFTDLQLFCLLVFRMVLVSLQHGVCGASVHSCAYLGALLGPVFHHYSEGYRVVQFACDLIEKHGFLAYQAKAHHSMGLIALWTQPISAAIDSNEAAFRTALETGDLTNACYSRFQSISILLLKNDPLDAVWRASERALDFAREAKYGDVADVIRSQQRLIAAMQGRTASFSTFSDAQFDESAFEAQLTPGRMPFLISYYWILKLKARFLAGNYAEALVAADQAKSLLWGSTAQIQVLDYFYYTALTVAALYETASANEQQPWRELLTVHKEQLREWAESYSPTFRDKYALVSAEAARIEGRDLDAMRLYEQAIQSARENGFVQNEGLAHEVAARFHAARGFETLADACRRNARDCYLRWGATGKVRQLEQLYPQIREEEPSSGPTGTIGAPVEHLDLATMIKVSQAVSGEIVLEKLIDTLMRTAIEHAGAEHGLLMLLHEGEPQLTAEATTRGDTVVVRLQDEPVTEATVPVSIVHYVVRTQQSIILDDATAQNPFPAEDSYIHDHQARSLLCLPLMNQAQLIGVLYLENNLTSHVFTPARIAVLNVLASQAAISLKNAALYDELRRSEAYLVEAQKLSHTGSFGWKTQSEMTHWSEETYKIFEYDRALKPTREMALERIHPDDQANRRQIVDRAAAERTGYDLEYRLLMPHGSIKHIHVAARAMETRSGDIEFVGAISDITERKRVEDALRRSETHLTEAQRLTHTSSWAWSVATQHAVHVSEEWFRIYGLDAKASTPSWDDVLERIHPQDRARWRGGVDRAIAEKSDYEVEYRILTPDGTVKHLHVIGHPVLNASGELIEFMGSTTDITDRKLAEEKLRQSEADLLEAQRLSHTGSWRHNLLSGEMKASPELLRIGGVQPENDSSTLQFFLDRVHPDDRDAMIQIYERAQSEKSDYDAYCRFLLPDGTLKHLHVVGHPAWDESGDVIEFFGTATDVTVAKQAEERIRQSERELRQIVDLAPQHVVVLGPDRTHRYANQAALSYHGLTLEEWQESDPQSLFYPDDWARMLQETQSKFLSGSPHEIELRLRRKDGECRWFLFRFNPVLDEQGRITRWYVGGTDIEARKQNELRLQSENIALREEIDKTSMFEEIVGTSPPLQKVLSHISKVAPTDSTVLITGETGTGKELIARAIHKRSQRGARAFVSVNCAAIPRDLIASELFGHEKGAFTGATQRRLGRFELADGGTIFLDEVGELPAETQIALLRVLQEREFERVGGTGPLQTNVRVIAATNRDLPGAIAAGIFRSDLFYRLNVFPIEMPPLRARGEDIPLLVEYFIDRFSRKAGRQFQTVSRKSLDLLQSYPWPGNIRELQNVIERSVIVCDTENFSIDESWLSRQPAAIEPEPDSSRFDLSREISTQEKALIEAALSECEGRVYGPSGAAAKLGMPRSTLESKIRSLKINKNLFKTANSSKPS